MILLVEDDVGIGRSVVQGLGAKGHAVRWLRQGAGVFEVLAEDQVAAMILDVGLPDADGFELCQRIREAGHDLPVLMLTARANLDDRLDGFAAGADDYLPKPFAFAELVARVGVLARRASQLPTPSVQWAGFTADPARGAVTHDGSSLEIEPRAEAILRQLVLARGTLVSRAALIVAVWGKDAVITDNAIDVAVSTLRKRLAELTPDWRVRAIKGQGLRLEPADMVP